MLSTLINFTICMLSPNHDICMNYQIQYGSVWRGIFAPVIFDKNAAIIDCMFDKTMVMSATKKKACSEHKSG